MGSNLVWGTEMDWDIGSFIAFRTVVWCSAMLFGCFIALRR